MTQRKEKLTVCSRYYLFVINHLKHSLLNAWEHSGTAFVMEEHLPRTFYPLQYSPSH